MYLPSSVVSEEKARELGYKPLTVRYQLPEQRKMLDNAQKDMDAGGIKYLLVGEQTAPEIWRLGMVDLADSAAIKIPLEPIGGKKVTV